MVPQRLALGRHIMRLLLVSVLANDMGGRQVLFFVFHKAFLRD
jgi:hypothetical protein